MWTLLKLISVVGLVFAVVAVTQRASQASLLTPLGRTLTIESPNGRDPGRFFDDRSANDAERSPCTDRKEAVLRNIPVNDAEQAIALFQCYWESIVLSGLRDESQQKTLARTMTERVRTRKTLSGRLASYREIYHRVDDTSRLRAQDLDPLRGVGRSRQDRRVLGHRVIRRLSVQWLRDTLTQKLGG